MQEVGEVHVREVVIARPSGSELDSAKNKGRRSRRARAAPGFKFAQRRLTAHSNRRVR